MHPAGPLFLFLKKREIAVPLGRIFPSFPGKLLLIYSREAADRSFEIMDDTLAKVLKIMVVVMINICVIAFAYFLLRFIQR